MLGRALDDYEKLPIRIDGIENSPVLNYVEVDYVIGIA
jgi:hypothetical protein